MDLLIALVNYFLKTKKELKNYKKQEIQNTNKEMSQINLVFSMIMKLAK